MGIFSSNGVRVSKFGGGEICISGVAFEGSAVNSFWIRYIEPFIEDAAIRAFENTRRLAFERKLDLRRPLEETAGAIIGVSRKAFARMADIDRRLRGGGFPDSVPLRDTKSEQAAVENYILQLLRAELATESRWRRFESFIQRNPALWGGLLSLAGFFAGWIANRLMG